MKLHDLLTLSANHTPTALAVQGPDKSMTYGELDRLANRFAHAFIQLGIRRGDRVGIWLEKSPDAIAAMQGVLRLGAAYVPLDPLSPATRINTILQDCSMHALVTTRKRVETLTAVGSNLQDVACLYLDETDPGMTWPELRSLSEEPVQTPPFSPDEMAYILYTSGSTGRPKGVCISHRNALAFITWAAKMLQATSNDRFANHAPFHFDLSVLDLYVAFLTGARVILIPDGMSYLAQSLVPFIIREKITIWYSVPSVLTLMMEQGNLLSVDSLPLRCILFAGEPFPIKHLYQLYKRWPTIRFINLYGPTETNVCTYYEVRTLSEGQTCPIPIGRACSGDRVWAQKEDGTIAGPGEEGELMVTGPTVMLGYWGGPPQNGQPYATGDIVRLQEDGNYLYVGRRDHMVKVRGHRVELGDIEAALLEHPTIYEAAVLVIGAGIQARLAAFVVPTHDEVAPLLAIKRHCAERLPRYMIVDEVHSLPALPRTRNGKVDRLQLAALATQQDEEKQILKASL